MSNVGFSSDHIVFSSWNNLNNIHEIHVNVNDFNGFETNELKLKGFWDNLRVTHKLSVASVSYKANDIIFAKFNEFPVFGEILHIIIYL